jgi:hypothetical protein
MSITGASQYIENINTSYPLPGVSNNVQGFRNNFSNMQAALTALDSYMDELAATTQNVNTATVTGTQLITALENIKLGTSSTITLGALNDIVVIGKNPNGTPAAGSIAFLPNVIPMSIDTLSVGSSSFNSYNTTTGLIVGATFTATNPVPSGPYTITSIDGYTVNFTPAPTFIDKVVYVTNPQFELFTVVNATTVTTILSELFTSDVVFSAGIESTAYNTGTVVVEGGVGITESLNVNGNVNIGGNLNIQGNLISTSTSVSFDNLTVAGTLLLTNANETQIASSNTASWAHSLTGGLSGGNINNGTVTGSGYHVLPSGLIIMWGTLANVTYNTSVEGNLTTSIPLPTLPGRSTPGFPNMGFQAMATTWNFEGLGTGFDPMVQIVSVSASSLIVRLAVDIRSPAPTGNGAIEWMVLGF